MKSWAAILGIVAAFSVAANAFAEKKETCKNPKVTLQERFNKMDTIHDGILSEQELTVALKSHAEKYAKEIFEKMGGKSNHPLSLAEFTSAREQWQKKMAEHHKEWKSKTTAKESFSKMDANHDGKLSQSEFVAHWVKESEARADRVFHEMGGTKNKGISFVQYQKAHKAWEKSHHHVAQRPESASEGSRR